MTFIPSRLHWRAGLWSCAAILICTQAAKSQSSAGTLLGTVKDPSGGVVPRALVEARDLNTGAIRSVKTNDRGDYQVLELPVGRYEASVEAAGFKRTVRPEIAIEVEQSVRVDFTLEVGAPNETVSIIADAPAIDSEKGTIENRVLSDQMIQLPLNGRNPIELMNLNAGVDYGRSSNYEAVSGNRDDGSVLNVEGAMSIDVLGRALLPVLPLDAVAEFVIKTSIPTADSGLGNSAVGMAVKSGSNTFHGSLYEFWRGNAGNARDYFNPTNVLPPYVRNQFGGSFGGPIIRNRTFIFVNYELTRQASSTNARSTVPTAANRNGMLSGTVKDPLTGQPFPGAQVPASRFDPLSLQMLQYMPEPNLPGAVNNYYTQIKSYSNSSTPIARLDQQFTQDQRLMLMARGTFGRGYTPGVIPTVGGLYTWNNADAFTVRHDWVITPHLLNQAGWGFFKNASISYPQLRGTDVLAQLGLTAFMPSSPSAENGFPDVRITGFPNLTDVGSVPGISNQRYYSLTDDLSWVRGNHSLKFGGSVYWLYLRRLAVSLNRGQLLYQGTLSGSPMADFLLGLPSQASADVGGNIANETRTYFAGYVMDDWRITSRLTFNIGLRYELYTIPTEDSNRFASYDIPTRDLVVSSNSNTWPSGVLPQFYGSGSPIPIITTHQAGIPLGFSYTNTKDFAPRAGFAYRLPLHRTTVVRGGYGWFYNPIRMDARLIAANNNAPFQALEYYQNVLNRSPMLLNAQQSAANMGIGSTSGATLQINGIARDFPDSLDPQWNFTIERDLGAQFTGRISYVGNRGIDLPVNLNYAQDFVDTNPATGKPQLDRIERRVNPVDIEEAASRSFYHALQTELRREFRHDISVQLNWTWQKLLSDAETDQSIPQNSFCLRCDYADAAYTRRHMVKFNFIYDLPFGPGKHFLHSGLLARTVGGWRLSGIGQWETGLRFSPTYSKTGATDDLRAGRPDLVGNPNSGPRTVLDWFNLNAFLIPVPPPGDVAGLVFGNAARNLVVGPNLSTVNLSLQKLFRLTERATLTLRIETFNAFNHTNLGSPGLDLSQVTAGVISSTAATARQNQFAARIDF